MSIEQCEAKIEILELMLRRMLGIKQFNPSISHDTWVTFTKIEIEALEKQLKWMKNYYEIHR